MLTPRARREVPTPRPTWAARGKAAGLSPSYCTGPREKRRFPIRTMNSGSASGASPRGGGCSAGGSQYRWCRVSVFTAQAPAPIMATTSSLDIARSRLSPSTESTLPGLWRNGAVGSSGLRGRRVGSAS